MAEPAHPGADHVKNTNAIAMNTTTRSCLLALTLGDITLNDDGSVLSSWGDAGNEIALNADGDVVWEMTHESGTLVSPVEVIPSLYP